MRHTNTKKTHWKKHIH